MPMEVKRAVCQVGSVVLTALTALTAARTVKVLRLAG